VQLLLSAKDVHAPFDFIQSSSFNLNQCNLLISFPLTNANKSFFSACILITSFSDQNPMLEWRIGGGRKLFLSPIDLCLRFDIIFIHLLATPNKWICSIKLNEFSAISQSRTHGIDKSAPDEENF
jgi:hypothetical protein